MRRNGIIFMTTSKEVANLTPEHTRPRWKQKHMMVVKHLGKYRRIMYQALRVPSYLTGEQRELAKQASLFICYLFGLKFHVK